MRLKKAEPIYDGKSLSQLFFHSRGYVWMPNDFYGHIHDELWYKFTSPPESSETPRPTSVSFSNVNPKIDTNALSFLIQWMSFKSTVRDRVVARIVDRLPATLSQHLYSYTYSVEGWDSRAGLWHIAACEGFKALGTNAEPALPALSNLLVTAQVDLPLTLAIASIGPKGIKMLSDTLANTNTDLLDNAALALGLQFQKALPALPALVACVQRGQADYHVLGAIGRIGGKHPQLVPSLIQLLEAESLPEGVQFSEDMAILVLALHESEAHSAIPVLVKRYKALAERRADPTRRLLRRAIRRISPETEAELGPLTENEKWNWWP